MNNIVTSNATNSDQQQGHSSDHSGTQNNSTPVHSRKLSTHDPSDLYSPIFSQYTQEEYDNVDVMWDWYSPQSKPRKRRQKKPDLQQSPKLTIKRQPSNNQITVFNKLKEELETLRDHIIEDTETDQISTNNKQTETDHKLDIKDLEDVFNDSMEEELIKCSQEAENKLGANSNFVSNDSFLRCFDETALSKDEIYSVTEPDTFPAINYVSNHMPKRNDGLTKIADDSFDFILQSMKDEDLEFSNPPAATNNNVVKRHHSHSDVQDKNEVIGETATKCTADEIERKRREALAKLEIKKKQTTCEQESPIKCSPEEIEKKRLQALAKLEAKKKQDIIERNRQEALKRLEMSKRKRTLQSQTSLSRKVNSSNF